MHRSLPLSMFLLVLALVSHVTDAATKNGFDVDNAIIPKRQILAGGPDRDGIPAIDKPRFIPGAEATLAGDARVLGILRDGEARAYPINILNWHEIVNDRFGDVSVVVTYCPLCGSGMVFSAPSTAGNPRDSFGVSGLLYDSDMLIYDRATESLWSQIMAQAVAGPRVGERLTQNPARHTTWARWFENYPDTSLLSENTGYRRDYSKSPYGDYEKSRRLYFRVSKRAPKTHHPKALVLGVSVGDAHRAYPFSELEAARRDRLVDELGGEIITIHWDAAASSAYATSNGTEMPTTTLYWFAWYTFHPETSVFSAR